MAGMVDERREEAGFRGAAVSDEVACRYYGRDFTTAEMTLLRELIATEPTRAAIARAFCRRTGWLKPDGGLKTMMAKVAMLAMHRDGIIELPPPSRVPPVPKPITFEPDTEPPSLFPDGPQPGSPAGDPDRQGRYPGRQALERVRRGTTSATRAWSVRRCAVHDCIGRPLAMLGFSTAAWRLAPRDAFIGWTPELRKRNLPLVVDNPRFLILPWILIPNLGSHVLSLVCRRLPEDWTVRYGTTPVLCETFVEVPRHSGGVYLGLDTRRDHPGARSLRPVQQGRQTEEGHLALPAQEGLEAQAQPLTLALSAALGTGDGKPGSPQSTPQFVPGGRSTVALHAANTAMEHDQANLKTARGQGSSPLGRTLTPVPCCSPSSSDRTAGRVRKSFTSPRLSSTGTSEVWCAP